MGFFRNLFAMNRQAKVAAQVAVYLNEAQGNNKVTDSDKITAELYRYSFHLAPAIFSDAISGVDARPRAMAISVLASGLILSNSDRLPDNADSYRESLDASLVLALDSARPYIREALRMALNELDEGGGAKGNLEQALVRAAKDVYFDADW